MWLAKQVVLIALFVVMMAAWNIPSIMTWGFWIGVFAFAFYTGVDKGWRA